MRRLILLINLFFINHISFAQSSLCISVLNNGQPVPNASVQIDKYAEKYLTDTSGICCYNHLKSSFYKIFIYKPGYLAQTRTAQLNTGSNTLNVILEKKEAAIEEVVVTGTMKEISKQNSTIAVDIITPKFFRKNPTPNLFEAVGMLNGVKPQLNCNVCNTGDIHINGMEGPYTMILIDGMPIVSSLSTVYGLSGIPNSIVERIEIVKGPASSLYGAEAMGGIINVITKNPQTSPAWNVDAFATSWQEFNIDLSTKITSNKLYNLLGVNYYNYSNPIDNNNDHFTDVTLQNRLSVFNKLSVKRLNNKISSIASRFVYENRWGGEMNWSPQWRGSDSIYGESIYTKRWELIAQYQLPVREKIMSQFSYNWHDQDSYYGKTPYIATQQVAFGQVYWDKQLGKKHSFLLGSAIRYIYYDDNSPATASPDQAYNQPEETLIPGVFIQDEWTLHPHHTLLAGYRLDYDHRHGLIHSPRLAYKWSPGYRHTIRGSIGTGYRVVNLFTEDHAALTGARQVVIAEALRPERSYNANINYLLKNTGDQCFYTIELNAFYTYFTNKIIGDFDSDPDKIIYQNLTGHAVSRGISVNLDLSFLFPLKIMTGITYMDVYQVQADSRHNDIRTRQLHAPPWSGNFILSYSLPKGLSIDLTGNWYGPMRLPVLPNDYRPEYSPWFCLANIQLTKKWKKQWEVYGGVKNLLNFVPKDPIMRPYDPFDKQVNDPVNNPQGYTFDPSYNYAPLQGIRGFLGIRWSIPGKGR